MYYYRVLLQVPIEIDFVYFYEKELPLGIRVKVSLWTRNLIGILYKKVEKLEPNIEYKEIEHIIDEKPIFTKDYLTFLETLSNYYQVNIQISFMKLIPKSIITSSKLSFNFKERKKENAVVLSKEQQEIAMQISPYINSGYNTFLIYGVTGSGKTEIYMELAKKVMQEGKQVLYLLPEISLTSQLIKRLSKTLGLRLSAYHSKCSPKKRRELFWGFQNNDIKFLIGARSALFIPAKNIGLIIVDEEHEFSYKQDDSPFYQLRDMAILYAKITNIPVILGSATPSIASYYNTKKNNYKYYKLEKRYNKQILPEIKIIDMKKSDIIENILSTELYDKIFNCINKNEQAILLLNRKGYSNQLICRKCGSYLACPNCSVSMIYYKSSNYAKCSYCGTSINFLKCSNCNSSDFINFGFGTEKAFELLNNLFKNQVLKIDMDDVTSQKKLDLLLEDFANKKYKILLGTQIIAKGLNFEDVTLVGVLNIDNQFSLPDFRASEKAYQLLLQVAGRAGRFKKKGAVYIQTFNTEETIFSLLNNDIEDFYQYELQRRKLLYYPPYTRMIRIVISYIKVDILREISQIIADKVKKETKVHIFGPAPSPIFKIKNNFRYNILLKSSSFVELNKAGKLVKKIFTENKKTNMNIRIDVDPYNFM